jgi:two-component system sensor histidine kinase/response regulator
MAPSEYQAFILVVEDDPLMAQGIADILNVEGYRVETVPNGRAALMKMRSKTPDLVLSDIMMPEMDGYDLCALVRATPQWRTLPFIFLTALGQKVDRRRGLELGADRYLAKPFEPDDLLLAVRSGLQRAADHRAETAAAISGLRTTMLATLNHEFRIPLTYITGYSQLLADEGMKMDQDNFRLCVSSLCHGVDRLRRLVENVLILTQIDSGELKTLVRMFPQRTENISDIVSSVVRSRQLEAKARQVRLETLITSGLPSLAISVEYVSQIIDHLLDNAIRFSNAGGTVTLTVSRADPGIELSVSDDGIGIRTDALAWVFDGFRQVDRPLQEQQGAGLGLAIVRGLAEAHGGGVTIESAPDTGTTVTVYLPSVSDVVE